MGFQIGTVAEETGDNMAKKRATSAQEPSDGRLAAILKSNAERCGEPQLPSDWPIIPRVVVRREWPYFDEDEDTEALYSVYSDVVSLWYRMQHFETALDDLEFFGETAEYWMNDAPCVRWRLGDARPAIANYRHCSACWQSLLAKPCWEGVKAFPPVAVMAALFDNEFGSVYTNAMNIVRFQKDDARAIKLLERSRTEAVAVISPTMALFFASLTAVGLKKPAERDDAPNDDELAGARQVCRANTNITRDALADQLEIGNNKASRLMQVMRDEGILKGKPRKSLRNGR